MRAANSSSSRCPMMTMRSTRCVPQLRPRSLRVDPRTSEAGPISLLCPLLAAARAFALTCAVSPIETRCTPQLDEFDAWKVRELKRVRRERQERDAEAKEKAELERRRNLTDAERVREDEAFRAQRADAGVEKGQWKFLQKYYHKGAYFQDEDETGNNKLGPVMMQDFGAATGKDRIGDKSALPAPMQVKNFGMRSQVKWTHLGKEDTMSKDKDRPMWAEDKRLAQKFERKGAGTKAANDFDRPSAKRKKA